MLPPRVDLDVLLVVAPAATPHVVGARARRVVHVPATQEAPGLIGELRGITPGIVGIVGDTSPGDPAVACRNAGEVHRAGFPTVLFTDDPAAPPDGVIVRPIVKLEILDPGGSVKDHPAVSMIDAAEAGVVCPTTVPPDHPGSYCSVADRLTASTPGGFQPNQCRNPANPLAHERTTGPEIWRQTAGRVTHFVAGIGTGGTVSGVGRYLESRSAAVQVIGADPGGSICCGGGGPTVPRGGRRRGLLARRVPGRDRRDGAREQGHPPAAARPRPPRRDRAGRDRRARRVRRLAAARGRGGAPSSARRGGGIGDGLLLERTLHHAGAFEEPVGSVVEPQLVTVGLGEPVQLVTDQLQGSPVVLVLDGGHPVGILTGSDVLSFLEHREP